MLRFDAANVTNGRMRAGDELSPKCIFEYFGTFDAPRGRELIDDGHCESIQSKKQLMSSGSVEGPPAAQN